MAAWGLGEWPGRWRWGRVALAGGAVAVILACAAATGRQVAVWQNSVTLFEHALAAGRKSPLAHYNLAHALAKQGRTAEAITHYREALQLKPDEPRTHDNLGLLLADQGRTAEAIAEIREALRLKPDRPGPLNNLAWILAASPEAELRDGAGAVRLAERACKLTAYQEAGLLDTLAVAYAEAGRFPEALGHGGKSHRDCRKDRREILGRGDPIAIAAVSRRPALSGTFAPGNAGSGRPLALPRVETGVSRQVRQMFRRR